MSEIDRQLDAVRRFNRFYTKQIGVLHEHLLKSEFPLTEARVLYELAHVEQTTARTLSDELNLDAGYLSRILRSFTQRGLIEKAISPSDGRQTLLQLSEQGRAAFATMNERALAEVAALLEPLAPFEQRRLVEAMQTIETLLSTAPPTPEPYLLRPHQPGDMGWVVHRHGVLYAQEYGWNEEFEALIAEIVAHFIHHFDPQRERCWIAERHGEIVGSVFVVKQSDEIAKLRLLYVEPSARGLGIGGRLVDECIRFAQRTGYERLVLWTNHVLVGARRIYERAGFQMTKAEPHHSFGHDLVGETWELVL